MFWRAAVLALVVAFSWPASARADGKRDLEDGIAFYENLDTERALERLRTACDARDLTPGDRAKAFLYLGLVQFESGERPAATDAWKKAVALDRGVQIPSGTSPKAIEAIEAVRASGGKAKATGGTDEPGGAKTQGSGGAKGGGGAAGGATKSGGAAKTGDSTPTKLGTPTETNDLPVEPEGDAAPDLTAKSPAPATSDDAVPTWLLIGGIGAVAVGAVVVTVLLLGGGQSGDCKEGGGCLTVTFE